MTERCDVAVVGAGAAGLFAALWAGRTAQAAGHPVSVVALDGARKIGAKILVAGGGRCNVTHFQVSERDYAGSTPPAIRNVLRAFTVERTVAFFAELGVELKRESTGKLFPVTDDAHTVLDALLRAVQESGAALRHPMRVEQVQTSALEAGGGFHVSGPWGALDAGRVVLCMGGMALPKSGSDGAGFEIARSLGHSIAQPVVPALVPLLLADGHWVRELSGLTLPAEFHLRGPTGKRLATAVGSTLCTHFGLSGPAVLDISRHLLVHRAAEPMCTLDICWMPGKTSESFDRELLATRGRSVLSVLRDTLSERIARALCQQAAVDSNVSVQQMPREGRRRLVELATACTLPVTGDRGFTYAEATAGGVPLAELRLDTMESRIVPGLHIAGELCDVDGRIGGFNFQWAWASGYLAGRAAAVGARAT
ncbi:MAG: aminoacetone oxidase family FAD-binding enzyme [Phycisphaerae bacterium]|nr:aminoacetone oxidase family FAD-binding enzyme [Phycisphaerae bacterium]